MGDNDEREEWADTSFITDPVYGMLQMKFITLEGLSEEHVKWLYDGELPLDRDESVIGLDPNYEKYLEREDFHLEYLSSQTAKMDAHQLAEQYR